MLKNALGKLAKRSNRRMWSAANEKKAVVEVIANEHRSSLYNRKSARNKSMRQLLER